jgi:hypothetical protein
VVFFLGVYDDYQRNITDMNCKLQTRRKSAARDRETISIKSLRFYSTDKLSNNLTICTTDTYTEHSVYEGVFSANNYPKSQVSVHTILCMVLDE